MQTKANYLREETSVLRLWYVISVCFVLAVYECAKIKLKNVTMEERNAGIQFSVYLHV